MNIKYKLQDTIQFIEDKVNSELMTTDNHFLQLKVLNIDATNIDDSKFEEADGMAYLVDYGTGLTVATVDWINSDDSDEPSLLTITPYKHEHANVNLTCFYLHLMDIDKTSSENYLVQMGDDNFHTKKPKKILSSFNFRFGDKFQFVMAAIASVGLIYWIPVIWLGFETGGFLVFLFLLMILFIVLAVAFNS
jgi:hypothetical protein